MKKKIFILTGIILFVLLVFLNIKTTKKGKIVEIEVVKKESIKESIKVDGTIEAKNQVVISAEVIGKIHKIYVKKGEFVKKGKLLCVIDPSEYRARRDRIKVMLKQTLYELSVSKKNYEREKILYEKNLISKAEFEKRELEYKRLLFKLRQDSFSLKEAEDNLKKCYITAPIDGEVMEIFKKEGETVIAGTINNPGSRIMVIADRSEMIVKCKVDETEIPKIKKGLKVNIKIDAFPDTIFNGEVIRISGISNPEEGIPSFPVEVEIKGENVFLLPGMTAVCEIIIAQKDSAFVLPYSAVGKEKRKEDHNKREKFYVFMKEKGKAKKRFVKLGIRGLLKVEIKEGIKKGDTVIIGPEKVLKKLKEGEKIQVKKEKNKE